MVAPTTPTPPPVVTHDRLEVWVPVSIVSEANARDPHWSGRSARAKRQRQAVSMAILSTLRGQRWQIAVTPSRPKRVAFTLIRGGRLFDTDNLAAALKHVRDGLAESHIIDHDGTGSGHEFVYEQERWQPTKHHQGPGVRIVVTLR